MSSRSASASTYSSMRRNIASIPRPVLALVSQYRSNQLLPMSIVSSGLRSVFVRHRTTNVLDGTLCDRNIAAARWKVSVSQKQTTTALDPFTYAGVMFANRSCPAVSHTCRPLPTMQNAAPSVCCVLSLNLPCALRSRSDDLPTPEGPSSVTFIIICAAIKMVTVSELRRECKQNGVRGYSKMKKRELEKRCRGGGGGCVIQDVIKVDTVVPHTSVSQSIVVMGKTLRISAQEVVIKLAFRTKSAKKRLTDALAVEEQIYRRVKMGIPFVMRYVATIQCPDFDVRSQPAEVQRQYAALKKASSSYDYKNGRMLVIERGRGASLDKIAPKLTAHDWKCIVLQVIFALAYFETIGLMHNDLHFGNIWIEPHVETYALGDIVINTRYQVKIYDFDRSFKGATKRSPLTIRNTSINCARNYECSKFTVGRDYAPFVYKVLRRGVLAGRMRDVLRSTLSKEYRKARPVTGTSREEMREDLVYRGAILPRSAEIGRAHV